MQVIHPVALRWGSINSYIQDLLLAYLVTKYITARCVRSWFRLQGKREFEINCNIG